MDVTWGSGGVKVVGAKMTQPDLMKNGSQYQQMWGWMWWVVGKGAVTMDSWQNSAKISRSSFPRTSNSCIRFVTASLAVLNVVARMIGVA
jgi:hypothetical protein